MVLTEVAVLGEGLGFGEIAFMQDTTRQASIRTKDTTELLTLSKKDYMRVIQVAQSREFEEKSEYLSKISQFSHIPKDKMLSLVFIAIEKEYSLRHFIQHEGEQVDGMYVVIEGQFELSMTIDPAKRLKLRTLDHLTKQE